MGRIQAVLDGSAPWHVETCDVLDDLRMLPDNCVHCCVTSPPYWGLRDYGVDGQLGLEKTPTEFVAAMTEVFSEVRRVLREDGTLWLNIGDSYNAYNGGAGPGSKLSKTQSDNRPALESGFGLRDKSLKPKDLVGIPWMLAFALRADGWYLRSEIIWHKRAPMPESVTDRPTKAHEQVFLLAKSRKYFYDSQASAEQASEASAERYAYGFGGAKSEALVAANETGLGVRTRVVGDREFAGTRNMRTAWTLSPESFSGAHFATMPTELARKALLAGTSGKGCCSICGTPWHRLTEKQRVATRPGMNSKVNRVGVHDESPYQSHSGDICGNRDPQRHTTTVETIGWEAGCKCEADTMPCLAIDCFNGAATTGVVARRLGLRYIGFELNPEYADMSRKRICDDMPLMNGVR